jgi:hypothetical protein
MPAAPGGSGAGVTRQAWLPLPYPEWRATRDTLHMYLQVVGKLRLALSPFEPGWANVPLYVTAHGLTTSPMPTGRSSFDAEVDLVDHVLVMRTSDGLEERRALGGTVADFYRDVMAALRRMGIEVSISVHPSEVADPIPFPDDRTHQTYNPDQATRFHRVLSAVDLVMKEHRARFRGRTTPVHFFWGTFDLALTRYSGRQMDPPADAGVITRYSADAEEICAGWWPGDERTPHPAFYCYASPPPGGGQDLPIQPAAASWSPAAGEFLLDYDAVIAAPEPRRAVLDFLDSTYGGLARLMGWSEQLTTFETPRTGSTGAG